MPEISLLGTLGGAPSDHAGIDPKPLARLRWASRSAAASRTVSAASRVVRTASSIHSAEEITAVGCPYRVIRTGSSPARSTRAAKPRRRAVVSGTLCITDSACPTG